MSDIFLKCENLCVDFPIANQPDFDPLKDNPSGSGKIIQVGKQTYLRALDNLNLDIKKGERIGIWGKNGSGKTTLLKVMRGVYPPTSGSLEIQGSTQSFFNLSFGMNEDATGYENLIMRGVLMGATPKQMRDLTDEIAEFSELGSFLNMPVRGYSAGMKMRLAFSVAVTLPADILLMDEWLSVGDIDFRQKAAAKLREVVRASKILMITSHNKSLLERVCTKIITINSGCIVSIESLEQN